MADEEMRSAAIRRIEESRQSHAAWAEHIPTCDHCKQHGPPPYIQSEAEHRQIVAEYDVVLAVLRGEHEQGEESDRPGCGSAENYPAPEPAPLSADVGAKSGTGAQGEADHECDTGYFDRTRCGCGAMHSYCDICGKRADQCPLDREHEQSEEGGR